MGDTPSGADEANGNVSYVSTGNTLSGADTARL